MTNEKVILQFLDRKAAHTPYRNIPNGVYTYLGCTLKSNGLELINYNTRIAYWEKDILHINLKKYSSTTSRIQSKIQKFAKESDIPYIEEYN